MAAEGGRASSWQTGAPTSTPGPWPLSRSVPSRSGDDGITVEVAPGSLTFLAFRSGGIRASHVKLLSTMEGRWAPVLITPDLGVIDGAHRVSAALALGLETIVCELFEGDSDASYLEFVRRNVHQGLPLKLSDRKRAGAALLLKQPDWSDRSIAEFCALSPHTVASLRQTLDATARPPSNGEAAGHRVGLDGRRRPVVASRLRERIERELQLDPERPLREIAAATQCSPETVRLVRRDNSLPGPARGGDGVSNRVRGGHPGWVDDAALQSMPEGEQFLAWFERTSVGDNWSMYADQVPLSRVYEVADEARRRSSVWRAFAEALEGRANGHETRRTG